MKVYVNILTKLFASKIIPANIFVHKKATNGYVFSKNLKLTCNQL